MRFELQRADFWKRISAFLFDIIIIAIIVVGMAAALSAIFGYDEYVGIVEQVEAEYVEKYGLDPDITEEEFQALSEEERAKYTACDEARMKDERLIIAYNIMINLALLITSASILVAYLIAEFAIPLFFKNGQTLGKKAFGLAVVHTNGVRMRGQAHFIRTVIGKCIIEAMVPAYLIIMTIFGNLGIVGLLVVLLMLVLQIAVLASTKTRSAIHDLIADTVVVDMASQMIFENADELIAYKTRIHEEMANKKEY
jgi:uncharacterized RDD family membrane protein YckC